MLVIQLWNSTREEDIDPEGSVTVSVDGTRTSIEAGGTVSLGPGQSTCLHPKLYHKFWGDEGTVLVGEVSSVNDDRMDNRFHEPVGRFTRIEEDEEPLHLLCTDYGRYYGWA